jgi:hypothetical protein
MCSTTLSPVASDGAPPPIMSIDTNRATYRRYLAQGLHAVPACGMGEYPQHIQSELRTERQWIAPAWNWSSAVPKDLAYFITRQRQSSELAADSGDVAVRIAHQKMADHYADRVAALSPKP